MGVLISSFFKVPTLGIPISDLEEGTIIKINESGTPADFYVAKHDYESGLNGAGRTLLVRKDCYDLRPWDSSNVNAYASSDIDTWLNGTYKDLLNANIQNIIGTTKFYYTLGNGSTSVTTLTRSIFLLSVTELGKSPTYFNVEGSELPIANSLQIAYHNGSAVVQWTRTPYTGSTGHAYCLYASGGAGNGSYCTNVYGSRPAFTLPVDTLCVDNSDGTYSVRGGN